MKLQNSREKHCSSFLCSLLITETVPQKLEVTQPKPAPPPATQVNTVTPPPSMFTASSLVRKPIVFHIIALDKETAEKARGSLAKKLSDILTDQKVERELIANLSDDMINTIRKIPDVSKIDLHIGKKT